MNTEPPSASHDSLLNALISLGKIHGVTVNPESATSGLPLSDGRLTPQLFTRAAERSGFKTKILKRTMKKIPNEVLPIVLLGENGEVYVLTKKGNRESEIIFSDVGDGSEVIKNRDLAKTYSGYAIMVKPEHNFEDRADFEKPDRPKNWFWGTLWGFRGFYGRVAMATVVINLFALASSIFVMNVYDRVVPNQAHETLWVLAIGALIAYVLEFCLKSLRTFMLDRAGQRADLMMGSRLFEQILAMHYSSRPESGGTLASQARAYEGVRDFFTSATLAALVDVPFVFLFAFVIYALGGIVALPIVIGAILALAIAFILQFPMIAAVSRSYQATNQRHAMVIETLNSLETVKATRAESMFQSRMENCVQESAKAEGTSRGYSQLAINATGLIQQVVSIAIVIVAFYQILNENMTMGAMIACVILAGRGMAPLSVMASLLARLQQSRRSLKGLNEIMVLPREREDSEKKISVPDFKPTVEISNVSFGYPGADTIKVLSDVSLNIREGERVGLLGKNGSGKSTLMRQLLGLYLPTEGRIDVSGIDIRQIEPTDLRKNIAYMPQESQLFYGTLRENITVGSPWADEPQIWHVLNLAGIIEFVKNHPEGLDMKISEGGRSLSGGQRQAICLARALMNSPELLVFDEPTSSMDFACEKALITKIEGYLNQSENRTLILATHKSGLLEIVDRVIVLDQGKIIADGPKEVILRGSRGTGPKMASRVNQPAGSPPDENIALSN